MVDPKSPTPQDTDTRILELTVRSLTRKLDDLISACIDENEKPRAPTSKDIARARACLPDGYKNSFPKKNKEKSC